MMRYAALLRGVSPLNAKMPELKRAFEAAGFADVRTVLGSGNVVFRARSASIDALERRAEAAMEKTLGRSFMTIVRPIALLQAMLDADPHAAFRLKPASKRIVSFVRRAPGAVKLPIELDGARILAVKGTEIYSAYLPSPKGPVFMALIEKTFGKDITTRTWDTIGKLVR